MPDWRVLIVDDDPVAIAEHLRIVSAQPGFTVVAVASSSEEAHAVLRRGVQIDLILLDTQLPGASGAAFLRALRVTGGPEVVALTAAREPKVVQELIHLGVVDYLLKPFEIERLQEALLRFRERKRTLGRPYALNQNQIDSLCPNSPVNLLPKGVQRGTLHAVRLALRRANGCFSSAEEVARDIDVSRVTARRYLEYLVSSRQVEMDTSQEGTGRPRKLYRLAMVEH